jgi:hypothetical protein
MNAVLDKPRASAAKTAAACADLLEANFNRGRDLAVAMLEEADDTQTNQPDAACPHRAYRDGKAQVRFTEAFLLRLIADPSILDGFNAVLSAKLSDECDCPAGHYAVSMAEYSAGQVGADGTIGDPPHEEPELSNSAPAATTESTQRSAEPLDVERISMDLKCADAVLQYLIHVFLGESDLDSPDSAPGVLGAVQQVQRILGALHAMVMEVDAVLPEALRGNLFEAWSMMQLLEGVWFVDGGHSYSRLSDDINGAYFMAAQRAVQRASGGIDEVGGLAPAALREHWSQQ